MPLLVRGLFFYSFEHNLIWYSFSSLGELITPPPFCPHTLCLKLNIWKCLYKYNSFFKKIEIGWNDPSGCPYLKPALALQGVHITDNCYIALSCFSGKIGFMNYRPHVFYVCWHCPFQWFICKNYPQIGHFG
jgi:hypothetical protein